MSKISGTMDVEMDISKVEGLAATFRIKIEKMHNMKKDYRTKLEGLYEQSWTGEAQKAFLMRHEKWEVGMENALLRMELVQQTLVQQAEEGRGLYEKSKALNNSFVDAVPVKSNTLSATEMNMLDYGIAEAFQTNIGINYASADMVVNNCGRLVGLYTDISNDAAKAHTAARGQQRTSCEDHTIGAQAMENSNMVADYSKKVSELKGLFEEFDNKYATIYEAIHNRDYTKLNQITNTYSMAEFDIAAIEKKFEFDELGLLTEMHLKTFEKIICSKGSLTPEELDNLLIIKEHLVGLYGIKGLELLIERSYILNGEKILYDEGDGVHQVTEYYWKLSDKFKEFSVFILFDNIKEIDRLQATPTIGDENINQLMIENSIIANTLMYFGSTAIIGGRDSAVSSGVPKVDIVLSNNEMSDSIGSTYISIKIAGSTKPGIKEKEVRIYANGSVSKSKELNSDNQQKLEDSMPNIDHAKLKLVLDLALIAAKALVPMPKTDEVLGIMNKEFALGLTPESLKTMGTVIKEVTKVGGEVKSVLEKKNILDALVASTYAEIESKKRQKREIEYEKYVDGFYMDGIVVVTPDGAQILTQHTFDENQLLLAQYAYCKDKKIDVADLPRNMAGSIEQMQGEDVPGHIKQYTQGYVLWHGTPYSEAAIADMHGKMYGATGKPFSELTNQDIVAFIEHDSAKQEG